MFKLMDDCMLTFSGRTVDVHVRANINVVKRVSVLCVCVAFFYSWVSEPLEGSHC